MNKKNLSESDICDKFIRPAMVAAGWNGMDQLYREFPLRAGRVVVRGHQRGLDDQYYQKLVLDYLGQYGQATRADLDALLLGKLAEVLSPSQKANKIKNLLQAMRRTEQIEPDGPRSATVWRLSKTKRRSF